MGSEQEEEGRMQTRQAGRTHLLAPGLVVGTQEEQAGTGHGTQGIPYIRSGQEL